MTPLWPCSRKVLGSTGAFLYESSFCRRRRPPKVQRRVWGSVNWSVLIGCQWECLPFRVGPKADWQLVQAGPCLLAPAPCGLELDKQKRVDGLIRINLFQRFHSTQLQESVQHNFCSLNLVALQLKGVRNLTVTKLVSYHFDLAEVNVVTSHSPSSAGCNTWSPAWDVCFTCPSSTLTSAEVIINFCWPQFSCLS